MPNVLCRAMYDDFTATATITPGRRHVKYEEFLDDATEILKGLWAIGYDGETLGHEEGVALRETLDAFFTGKEL